MKNIQNRKTKWRNRRNLKKAEAAGNMSKVLENLNKMIRINPAVKNLIRVLDLKPVATHNHSGS